MLEVNNIERGREREIGKDKGWSRMSEREEVKVKKNITGFFDTKVIFKLFSVANMGHFEKWM